MSFFSINNYPQVNILGNTRNASDTFVWYPTFEYRVLMFFLSLSISPSSFLPASHFPKISEAKRLAMEKKKRHMKIIQAVAWDHHIFTKIAIDMLRFNMHKFKQVSHLDVN